MDFLPQAETPVVYIVDDEPAVRNALGLLFRSVGLDYIVFPDAQAVLDFPIDKRPACLVSDLRMPLISGIELVETWRERGINVPAIIISGHGDIKQAVRALKCGATDFLEKPFDDQDLLDAVHAALKAAATDSHPLSPATELSYRKVSISPREVEVLRLVVDGWPNKRIARELDISSRTVEVHRSHVMQKLGASSLAELVRLTLASGILEDAGQNYVSNQHGITR
jgi:FixJ family two-component response regulator